MRKHLFVLLWVVVASCNTPATKTETAAPAVLPQATQTAESGPGATVRQFVRWYSANGEQLPGDFLLNADQEDTTKFYAVNIPGTEAWLQAVQQSGTVSETYLNGWRTYFRNYADTLRLHPQNDGPPAGFNYDFLMLTQEYDAQAAELQIGTFTVTHRQGRHAHVQARGPRNDAENWQAGLDFDLTQAADGRWLIDKITTGGGEL